MTETMDYKKWWKSQVNAEVQKILKEFDGAPRLNREAARELLITELLHATHRLAITEGSPDESVRVAAISIVARVAESDPSWRRAFTYGIKV